MNKKNILVTGGAGFIGSNLCDKLLSLGHKVVCVDNFDSYYPKRLKQKNIKNALTHQNFRFYEIDVTNYQKLTKIFISHKIDCIVHLAGRGGVSPSKENPIDYAHINITGTLSVLEVARNYKIPQIIFASSSSVYGPKSKIPFQEDDPCTIQVSPYGTTKRAAELFIQTYHNLYGIHATILRFFTVYGPRVRPDMALSKFTDQIINKKAVHANQDMKRDFTYIDDIVAGIISAIRKNLDFEIINLGNSKPVPIKKYIQTIGDALGIKPKIVIQNAPAGELLATRANITKAKKLLGYEPKTKLQDGIANYVRWLKG